MAKRAATKAAKSAKPKKSSRGGQGAAPPSTPDVPGADSAAPVAPLLADPAHQRADAKLAEQAMRDRWPVSPALRATILEKLQGLIEGADTDARTLVAAARAVLTADACNLREQAIGKLDDAAAGKRPSVTILNLNGVTLDEARQLRDTLRRIAAPAAAEPAPDGG